MKKVLASLVLVMMGLAGLVTWWNWPGRAPELPAAPQVQQLELTPSEPIALTLEEGDRLVLEDGLLVSDGDKLAGLLTGLSQGRQTRADAVNDQPYVTPYIRFELVLKDGSHQVFYVYDHWGKTYLELPYQGIYKLQQPLETWLAGLVTCSAIAPK